MSIALINQGHFLYYKINQVNEYNNNFKKLLTNKLLINIMCIENDTHERSVNMDVQNKINELVRFRDYMLSEYNSFSKMIDNKKEIKSLSKEDKSYRIVYSSVIFVAIVMIVWGVLILAIKQELGSVDNIQTPLLEKILKSIYHVKNTPFVVITVGIAMIIVEKIMLGADIKASKVYINKIKNENESLRRTALHHYTQYDKRVPISFEFSDPVYLGCVIEEMKNGCNNVDAAIIKAKKHYNP